LFELTAFTIVASLLLGGGTRDGMLSDAVLQLLSIPLLSMTLWRLLQTRPEQGRFGRIAIVVLIALLFCIELIPLPPNVWTLLPGRDSLVESFRAIGRPLPWAPITVAPSMTWSSLLSLIAPLGVFLAASSLSSHQRRRLALLILPVSAASVVLGLLQVAQGEESPLRFFSYTNPTEAVGFFANRNHLSAFLYCSILIAAAWLTDAATNDGSANAKSRFADAPFIATISATTLIFVLMTGQAMARSRAGIALTFVALLGALALASVADRQRRAIAFAHKTLLATIVVALAFSFQFALFRILARLDSGLMDETRANIARRTLEAALAYFPFGAGSGTFVPVYARFERPADLQISAYVNRAHNDLIEVFLETGVVGVGLMLAFLCWWAWKSWHLWRRSIPLRPASDHVYARAATLIVPLLLLHSIVDYPLRTTAMITVFSLACALMTSPPGEFHATKK
jgi:O-antigen ligase